MKKKMSPFMLAGFLVLIIGSGLNFAFRFIDVSWDYGLLAICINVLVIILMGIGLFKTLKGK